MTKYALITGGTKGIGLAIAESLWGADIETFNVYHSNRKQAEEVEKISNGKALCLQYDMSDYLDITKLANMLPELDYAIFNVGATVRTPFKSMSFDDWNHVINTNVTNPVFLLQNLNIKRHGRIIFISSILGEYPHSFSLAYGVSKAAINAMVKNLVKVYAEDKITVNAIAPGFVETDWHFEKSLEQKQKIESRIALKRMAEPSEIASLVLETLYNGYINGQILTIDGGYDYE